MYTSEEWNGELSAKSVSNAEGYLCSRFDFFPEPRIDKEFAAVVFSDDGDECYASGIVATSSWFHRFAQGIKLLVDCSKLECGFEMAAKITCEAYDITNENGGDIVVHVSKLGTQRIRLE